MESVTYYLCYVSSHSTTSDSRYTTMASYQVLVGMAVAMIAISKTLAIEYEPLYNKYEEHEKYAEPKYSFEYDIKDEHTGDIKSQKEVRNGHEVKGYYTLVQPDGKKRIVEYSADKKSGFNANVKYEGEGHAYAPKFTPIIKYTAPLKYSAPLIKYSLPKYESPKFEIKSYELPKYEAPKLEEPKFELPKYEEIKFDFLKEEPKFEFPKYETPKFDIKKYELPKYEAPKFEFPKFDAKKYELPKYEEPKFEFPKYEAPKFDIKSYELPKEEKPIFEFPKYEEPKYEFTKYEAPKYKSLSSYTF